MGIDIYKLKNLVRKHAVVYVRERNEKIAEFNIEFYPSDNYKFVKWHKLLRLAGARPCIDMKDGILRIRLFSFADVFKILYQVDWEVPRYQERVNMVRDRLCYYEHPELMRWLEKKR